MALILSKCAFVHIPRTGGSWTRVALRNAGVPGIESGTIDMRTLSRTHQSLEGAIPYIGNRPTWSYVRNPLTYLQSRWATKSYPIIEKQRKDKGLPYYDLQNSNSFEEFLRAYLEYVPGSVSRLFRRFLQVGDKYPAVTYVAKHENLTIELPKILEMFGESFDKNKLMSTAPHHQKSKLPEWKDKCQYKDPGLKQAIIQAEYDTFKTFNYD